ncbi:MAG: hypothetical protein JSS09_03905, partial [Verrucomicrobia bacterium]|nr:hypothetical protein [Verrucomicrobiota bacterium]
MLGQEVDIDKLIVEGIKKMELSYEDFEATLLKPTITLSSFVSVILGKSPHYPLGNPRYYVDFYHENNVYNEAVKFLCSDKKECKERGLIRLERVEREAFHQVYWIEPCASLSWALNQCSHGLKINPMIERFIEIYFKPPKRGRKPKYSNEVSRFVDLSQKPEHCGITSAPQLWETPMGEQTLTIIKKNNPGLNTDNLKKKIAKQVIKDPNFMGT